MKDGGLPMIEPLPFTCDLCGQKDDFSDYALSSKYLRIMQKRHICFQCAFWMDLAATPLPNREIISGCHFTVLPTTKRPHQVTNGLGGKEFYIRRIDGTLIKSNNIWYQGRIPQHFKEFFPNTADFLTLMHFQKLTNNPFKCHAMGCWDRYHCLRYDMECEKDGAFNAIPANHRIGDEKCPSFVTPFKRTME